MESKQSSFLQKQFEALQNQFGFQNQLSLPGYRFNFHFQDFSHMTQIISFS